MQSCISQLRMGAERYQPSANSSLPSIRYSQIISLEAQPRVIWLISLRVKGYFMMMYLYIKHFNNYLSTIIASDSALLGVDKVDCEQSVLGRNAKLSGYVINSINVG